jgi:hypothetical protein
MSKADWISVGATLAVGGAAYFIGGRNAAIVCIAVGLLIIVGVHFWRKEKPKSDVAALPSISVAPVISPTISPVFSPTINVNPETPSSARRLMDALDEQVRSLAQKPKIIVTHELVRDLVVVKLHNSSAGAEVWAPLEFSGVLINGPGGGAFALWDHTESIRTRIPKGGDAKLNIGIYIVSGLAGRWHFMYTTDRGAFRTAAMYTQSLVNPNVQVVPVSAELKIYTDPDSQDGVQKFKIEFQSAFKYTFTRL